MAGSTFGIVGGTTVVFAGGAGVRGVDSTIAGAFDVVAGGLVACGLGKFVSTATNGLAGVVSLGGRSEIAGAGVVAGAVFTASGFFPFTMSDCPTAAGGLLVRVAACFLAASHAAINSDGNGGISQVQGTGTTT